MSEFVLVQWTLLVGTLPIVFALASGSLHGLPILARQREELLLTAARSVFAVAILTNLSDLVLAGFMLVRPRQSVPRFMRDGLRTPYAQLAASP